jgi:hypothetical protein
VIGHLTLGEVVGWLPQQRCKVLAEMAVGKACGQELEEQAGTPESLHLRIGEAQCGGALRCYLRWTIDFLKGFFREDADFQSAEENCRDGISTKVACQETMLYVK